MESSEPLKYNITSIWTYIDEQFISSSYIQGVQGQTFMFWFALRDRNMQVRFGLKVFWESWVVDIWHLTYDLLFLLKVTFLSSTASDLKDGKIILKFQESIQKKKKFWKHQNRVILAIKLLILRIWVILKTSMTSMNMIASLNSMTSTSSVASKNQKQHVLYILSYFPDIRNLSSLNDLNSFNNLGGLNDFYSLNSSKNLLSLMFPSTLTWHILVS